MDDSPDYITVNQTLVGHQVVRMHYTEEDGYTVSHTFATLKNRVAALEVASEVSRMKNLEVR